MKFCKCGKLKTQENTRLKSKGKGFNYICRECEAAYYRERKREERLRKYGGTIPHKYANSSRYPIVRYLNGFGITREEMAKKVGMSKQKMSRLLYVFDEKLYKILQKIYNIPQCVIDNRTIKKNSQQSIVYVKESVRNYDCDKYLECLKNEFEEHRCISCQFYKKISKSEYLDRIRKNEI